MLYLNRTFEGSRIPTGIGYRWDKTNIVLSLMLRFENLHHKFYFRVRLPGHPGKFAFKNRFIFNYFTYSKADRVGTYLWDNGRELCPKMESTHMEKVRGICAEGVIGRLN